MSTATLLMSEGEDLGFELDTRPNGGPEGDEQSDKPGGHAGRERYQRLRPICNGDRRFGVFGRDTSKTNSILF